MVDLSVRLAGAVLRNPLIAAAGTCGYVDELADVLDAMDRHLADAERLAAAGPRALPALVVRHLTSATEHLDARQAVLYRIVTRRGHGITKGEHGSLFGLLDLLRCDVTVVRGWVEDAGGESFPTAA